jgi:RNA polymerase sigma-70 factor (ECF subfamily)
MAQRTPQPICADLAKSPACIILFRGYRRFHHNYQAKAVEDHDRLRWVATHILPLEGEVRSWLRLHACSLNASDVDDLIQESYARLWKAQFSEVTHARAYFYTIVRNLLAEWARRARVVPMERMGEIEALRIISEDPGPERRISARQDLDRLLEIIANLPSQCRRAFQLRKFDGLSQREIAGVMGITEKTVEKHLAKALVRITAAFQEARTRDNGQKIERSNRDSDRQQD